MLAKSVVQILSEAAAFAIRRERLKDPNESA